MFHKIKRISLVFTLLLPFQPAFAQTAPVTGKWWVEFTDKNNSPYCLCRPAEFLSARSLERRARAGVTLAENDLPVNPQYLNALKTRGIKIHNTSRWLNSAAIVADSVSAKQLEYLPFVRRVSYLGRDIRIKNPPNRMPKKRTPLEQVPKAAGSRSVYGYAAMQNSLLGLQLLQAAGHRGNGIWVAVMDGGFTNVDTMPFFDSVALKGRLFQGWDFVERDGSVFESASHGTSVLSVMAADLPGYFVGTAPEATYFLLKTEDTGGEFPVEEANWIAGAEWADSIGADIVNASLGYTTFNDSTLNHHYATLDGRTAIGSRGAAIAATKGMIICNSAGNSGDEPWRHIGVPADAPGVIAVGAVQGDESIAAFSSVGPTADGRIKPELVAPGDMVVVAGNTGTELGLSSGTSLASPMLTGAVASLWSAFPHKTAAQILDAVFSATDQNAQPDNERGYGLPDMTRAWLRLGGFLPGGNAPNNAREGFFSYDRAAGTLSFLLFDDLTEAGTRVELRDFSGQWLGTASAELSPARISTLTIDGLSDLMPGAYQALIYTRGGVVRLVWLAWR